MMSVHCFISEIEITSENYGITVDSTDTTLTVGTYKIYSPTASESFVDHLVDAMSAASGKTITYSISSSGKITISGSATFSYSNWETYDILGFAFNADSGSDTYEADNYLKKSWFPANDDGNVMPARALSPPSRHGSRESANAQTEALDQTVRTSKFGEFVRQEFDFSYLGRAWTWNDNDDNRSAEEFWQDVLSVGELFTYYPEFAGDGTETTSWDYKADVLIMSIFDPTQDLGETFTDWTFSLLLKGIE